ncbi:MAG: hypothetical protein PHS30_00090 [Bacteroidales bacterium]|nr:hypothetical protein [Bacteroidales bacterium]
MKTGHIFLRLIAVFFVFSANVIGQEKIFPGADQKTPSRSEYFSWINNTNEGATEAQTLINLDFFKWLNQEYGMQLDIYAFDAGAIDGANFYGSMNSERFKRQFPKGFGPVTQKAKTINTSLGLWGGPDGLGSTKEEEQQRIDMMVSLVRDFNFSLFKMDGVCGQLPVQKQDAFNHMMNECRKYNPNLILLNHRLNLGKGMAHSTTYLLGSAETYIDVHMVSRGTASHHRAGALSRELTPNLNRLTEDHGVCLSSCLDYWEDDLVLQAFNRNLIVSPQIYGNPWLLRDDEFPRLARIFNLHRKYRDILVNGLVLPEGTYGPKAVSRGSHSTRLLTLRNLTWNPAKYTVTLDESVGLTKKGKVQVKQYHPTEKIIGVYPFGSKIEMEVLPFRSCLFRITTEKDDERSVEGCHYEVIRDVKGKPLKIQLLGNPGEKCKIKLKGDFSQYQSAVLDGKNQPALLHGKTFDLQFPGTPLKEKCHRKLGDLKECKVSENALGLYEATCFAADNNALEVRSLLRSGATRIPQVQAARDAFFNQALFVERELWDKYLFDGDEKTGFSVCNRWPGRVQAGVFRLDLGNIMKLDSLVIKVADEYALAPLKSEEGVSCIISTDLKEWKEITFKAGKKMVIDLTKSGSVRYLCLKQSPLRIAEVIGYKNKAQVDRGQWKASNLFQNYDKNGFMATKAWNHLFTLHEIPEGSYLCIAINGVHGAEKAFAAITVDGKPIGCPDRNPSYQSNVWEFAVAESDRDYTYYVPLTKEMVNKKIEAFVLSSGKDVNVKPEIWITAYPEPFKTLDLNLYEK